MAYVVEHVKGCKEWRDRYKTTWKEVVVSGLKCMNLSTSHALDRKKWKNLLIRGGKGDSGQGSSDCEWSVCLICPRPLGGGIKRCCSLTCLSVWRLSRTSGLSREQRGLGRLKLAQSMLAHVTHDSDTTFKVRRSKVNLQGRGHIVAASRTACLIYYWLTWVCLWKETVKRVGCCCCCCCCCCMLTLRHHG